MTRVNAVRILRQVHKLSFDNAMFVTAYAREAGPATWQGCTFTVTYNANLGRYRIT